jgi:hypothetical protein
MPKLSIMDKRKAIWPRPTSRAASLLVLVKCYSSGQEIGRSSENGVYAWQASWQLLLRDECCVIVTTCNGFSSSALGNNEQTRLHAKLTELRYASRKLKVCLKAFKHAHMCKTSFR